MHVTVLVFTHCAVQGGPEQIVQYYNNFATVSHCVQQFRQNVQKLIGNVRKGTVFILRLNNILCLLAGK